MAIRIKLGRRDSSTGGDARGIGIAIAVFGLLLVLLAASEGLIAMLVASLAMTASGVWIAWLHRLVAGRAPPLAIVGGLFVGWSLLGGAAAVYHREWYLGLGCSVPLCVGLLLLGVLPVPSWAQQPLAVLRTIWPGLVFMLAGIGITLQGLSVGPSEGVPSIVAYGASLTFFLAGLLLTTLLLGGDNTIFFRVLVALVVTGLALAAAVFPPGLLLTAPIAVLSWIAVARLAMERITGRDPLASWSQERVLGLGCGVTLLLGLLVLGALQLRSCAPRPQEPLPLEAPEEGTLDAAQR